MKIKCLPVLHFFLLKRGVTGQFSLSQQPLWRPKLENPLPNSPPSFLTLSRVGWSSCLHLITHHFCPSWVWSISAQWDESRRTDGAESSLVWQAWKPAFLPLQLNEFSTSIQLHVLPWMITLSCRQTNPSPAVLVAAHCVPFSADQWALGERLTKQTPLCEPLRVVGHVTPSK